MRILLGVLYILSIDCTSFTRWLICLPHYLGQNYDAVVFASATCGFGMGATPQCYC
ncbi:MAG: sodium/glutamate symporter [Niameybacter sp.]|uniref:sodium/glutamate symporter n=1 Tax=Niameybacter sp. TaxID=2033640 RepID=UPI002FE6D7D9